jgi:LppP/LprE lipoprotein
MIGRVPILDAPIERRRCMILIRYVSLVRRSIIASAVVLVCATVAARQGTTSTGWLDRPLENWNKAGALLPAASAGARHDETRARCQVPASRTAAQRGLEQAGWIAYDHLDRVLSQGDVEVVAGMTDADGACRPVGFQIFVFVAGSFAGTLSPVAMTMGQDAAAGAVRLTGTDTLSAEFSRYQNADVPCCPTSHVTLRYRIDRSGTQPLLVPTDMRTTRGH